MRKKTMYGTVLFLALLIFMSTTASATDTRASSRFMDYSSKLRVESDGDLNIYFSVTASNIMDILGANKIAIQRYNGSRWVTESTLSSDDVPEMQTTNAIQHYAWIPYEPNYSNANYRAVVTFYAEDSSGSSTAQVITK